MERTRRLSEVVDPVAAHLRAASITQRGGTRPTYRFSEKSLALLRLLMLSMESEQSDRAWAVIGPYGAGKSSFGQMLVSLLSASDKWASEAIASLGQIDPELADLAMARSDEYLAVTALGSADGLGTVLMSAVDDALQISAPRSQERRRVAATLGSASHQDVLGAVQAVLDVATRKGKSGVVIVVDEFGRFLDGDHVEASRTLALIQDLAELANRSTEPQVHIIVMLHQNFDDYAAGLARSRRSEWAKVQGRFRQFSFQEDPGRLYESIASSLRLSDDLTGPISNWTSQMLREIDQLDELGGKDFWRSLLPRTYPLHPMATFALPRLGALLGQNERSLFAFLGSGGPHSLSAFLDLQSFKPNELPTLRLDTLYDYFFRGQTAGTLPARVRRSIALSQSALEQLNDGDGAATQVVKTLAVLTAIADQSTIQPSKIALSAATGLEPTELERTLGSLATANILLWREHSRQYVLNPGTDFDIESAIEYSLAELGPDLDVPAIISDALGLKPVVARRHSLEHGTTRVFQPEIIADTDVVPDAPNGDWVAVNSLPDGAIRFVLASGPTEVERARAAAMELTDPLVITVVPDAPIPCIELAREFRAVQQVMGQSIIATDRVARAELELRLADLREAIVRVTAPLLQPRQAWWYRSGLPPFQPQSGRDIQRLLSGVCDDVFSRSPSINNELVNRRRLSSSVVVAVKRILSALLAGTSEPGLGLDGNRPEVSIFRSLFRDSGWYSEIDGQWRLRRPARRAGKWYSVWHEIEAFLADCAHEPRLLSDLWDRLAKPPFGLRAGVMPILTMAVFIANRDRVCLFENGTYLPRWSIEHYDRIVRFPENFTIRSLVLDGPEGEALQRMTRALPAHDIAPTVETDEAALNTFLSRLFGWYRLLPDYSRKTQRLSTSARQFRAAMMTTQDPVALVLERIPQALGLPPVTGQMSDAQIDELQAALAEAGGEVAAAYPNLLDNIVRAQAVALRTSPSWTDVRRRYGELAEILKGYRLSDAAAVLLLRGADASLADAEWCESVGAAVGGQAPKHWSDGDVELCEQRLSELVHEIVEAADARMRIARRRGDRDTEGWRVLVQTADGADYEVISAGDVLESLDEQARRVASIVERAVATLPIGARREVLGYLMQTAVGASEGESDG